MRTFKTMYLHDKVLLEKFFLFLIANLKSLRTIAFISLATIVMTACNGATIDVTIKPPSSSSSSSSSSSTSSSSTSSSSSASSSSGSVISDEDKKLCNSLNGRYYLTEELRDGGRGPVGENLMHWRMHFNDGALDLLQSDFGISGKYYCKDGEVIVSLRDRNDEALTFDKDNSVIYFSPFGDTNLTYVRAPKDIDLINNDCRLVGGIRYEQAIKPIEALRKVFFEFDQSSQKVEFLVGAEKSVTGIYDCDRGELHIHRNAKDTNPYIGKASKDGKQLTVTYKDTTISLIAVVDNAPCNKKLNPVCAIIESPIVCVTTPCNPTKKYKTFDNECLAKRAKAEISFIGKCGDKEGKPVEDTGPICPAIYDPVCVIELGTIQCVTTPCPIGTYKTFSSQCHANGVKHKFVNAGVCGDKEGKPANDDDPGPICPTLYDPMCGIKRGAVQCVTTPCPSDIYKTYNNQCELDGDKAEFVHKGKCGKLEGKPVDNEIAN